MLPPLRLRPVLAPRLGNISPFKIPRVMRAPYMMAVRDFNTVLKGKYPAKAHAKRVADYVKDRVANASGVLYLESRATKLLEDNDEPEPFRQRRFFFYMTGVPLADSRVVYDLETSKLTLFIPPIDPEHVMWAGLPPSPEEILAKYDVDEVKYTTELNAALAHVSTGKKTTVFAIPEQVSDNVSFLEFEEKNFSILKKAIEDTRVVKDDYEIALIAKANEISSAAHKLVLEKVSKVENESELEAAFLGYCVAKGAKEQAYHSIVASGRSAATLHYIPNDAPMGGKLNLLLDAGAEWRCYAADITRTFPINGKFSPESRAIYDLVLKMQLECIAMLKEGVLWDDVHLLAHKIAIDGLLALGVLKGDKEAILKQRTSNAFFPHGLGHYLGMDTHDTGGNPNYSDPDPMFRYLRVRGALPAGSVITVEPGVYFSEFLIAPYLKDPEHSRYIDQDVLEKYWDVGGVRIEDNILITKSGHENLTTAVKDVSEMEKIISSS